LKLKSRRELPEARIDIIPMIDVMLFLLVFFMLSSLSLAKLNGLPVALPKTQTAPAQSSSPPTLTVQSDGSLFFNRQKVTLENLSETLRPFKGQLLLINADTRARHGVVVECMDAARSAGIEQFSIATLAE
jgi:biopolymer transport protein ExbD